MSAAKKKRSGPHPRSARMREEILWAAAEVFARKGYRAATMQAIAKAAGYTAASLYTYFHSKEEIFRALLGTLKAEMMATFDEPVPSGLSFAQRLELLLLRQYEVTERRRNALNLLLQYASEVVPDELSPGSDGHAAFANAFSRWMESNRADGDLGETPPGDAAILLMGISHTFFIEWLTGRRKGRLTEAAPHVVRFFLHGVSTARPRGPRR